MTSKLRWWLIFCLTLFGLVLAWELDVFHRVNEADVTKLSFVILIVFMAASCRIGATLIRDAAWKDRTKVEGSTKFIAKTLIDLGLIGTVIGFIFMLTVSLEGMENMQPEKFRVALQQMGQGMGTALYTTATGIICSLVLRLQARLLEGR